MLTFYLENVRCFKNEHVFPIRPLTFLVGENSSGKSTALAMFSFVLDPKTIQLRPSFNEQPYELGSFDTISTCRRSIREGCENFFALGYRDEINSNGKNGKYSFLKVKFIEKLGQPYLSELVLDTEFLNIVLKIRENSTEVKYLPKGIASDDKEGFTFGSKYLSPNYAGEGALSFIIYWISNEIMKNDKIDEPYKSELYSKLYNRFLSRNKIISFAPVRTKPKRTYDQMKDEFNPEGDHVPLELVRLFSNDTKQKKQDLMNALCLFGKESGLFKGLRVKQLGFKPSAPFQILISIAGPSANLLDVGYGVSQALPIVVQSILAESSRRILMQQPEVHLHPRAQAALGSLLVNLVKNDRKEFIIETHSDYIIDRIRREVAEEKIDSKNVIIFFFDKKGIETKVHPIYLDELGNLVNVPDSYRAFFLEEETKLLFRGRKKSVRHR